MRRLIGCVSHVRLVPHCRTRRITAMAPTVEQARERAYKAIGLIDWPEGFYRRDIAWRAVSQRS